MLLEPCQWLDCSSKLILEPFTGLQVSPNLSRFGLYVLESRERHALPLSKASFTIDESHL